MSNSNIKKHLITMENQNNQFSSPQPQIPSSKESTTTQKIS